MPFCSRGWIACKRCVVYPWQGVIPYTHVDIDDEDSLSERLERKTARKLVDIVVISLPRISNFTDFSPFEGYENVSLRYIDRVADLHQPDMILLPGTKSTLQDLLWLRQSGLEAADPKGCSCGDAGHGHLRRVPDAGPPHF